MTPRLFEGQVDWQAILLALIPTLMLAWLVARVVKRLAARVLQAIVGGTLATSSPLVPAATARGRDVPAGFKSALFLRSKLAGLRPRRACARSVSAWAFGLFPDSARRIAGLCADRARACWSNG
jgi:hypothetical protein